MERSPITLEDDHGDGCGSGYMNPPTCAEATIVTKSRFGDQLNGDYDRGNEPRCCTTRAELKRKGTLAVLVLPPLRPEGVHEMRLCRYLCRSILDLYPHIWVWSRMKTRPITSRPGERLKRMAVLVNTTYSDCSSNNSTRPG